MPDILDCLAQLSNDEVPTPPDVARAMLDLLPPGVWSNPWLRWVDPFSKSGVFLREVVARLLVGLEWWEPDFVRRREHIFRYMVHGVAITEMTGIISRRSLYYSRDASGVESVVSFASPDGNLPFVRGEHTFDAGGKCVKCRASSWVMRPGRENHAYSFIHGGYPTEEMVGMKFDVVVGNPPYQLGIDNNTRDSADANPLYHLFVEKAISLNPRFVVMIIPSRWFAGGKAQLGAFREQMIADRRLRAIVDHPDASDCFPGVKITGGVNFFLWDRDHDGDCEFTTRVNGEVVSRAVRDLRAGDGALVRDNESAGIIGKVAGVRARYGTLEDVVSTRDPFGSRIVSNYRHASDTPFPGSVPLVFNTKVGYVRPDQVQRNHDWVDRWKVLIPKASSGQGTPDGEGNLVDVVLGEPIALAPGSACTQTYLVAGVFDTADEAGNYAHYLATRFVRFLILQRKTTQDVTPDRFRFVPMLDMSRRWTDEDLYDHFGLTDTERAYVESTIKPRTVNLSLDSPVPASHLPGGYKYRPAGEIGCAA